MQVKNIIAVQRVSMLINFNHTNNNKKKTFKKINQKLWTKIFLTHFRRNEPAPFPLNTSKDRSF